MVRFQEPNSSINLTSTPAETSVGYTSHPRLLWLVYIYKYKGDVVAIVRVPIINVYGGGDYTAQITIGSNKTPANVIMDTGSSTLAVAPKIYDPTTDASLQKTPLAQDVLYGTGGWTGPVVKTAMSMGSGAQAVSIETYLALATEQEPNNFGAADGILGLAYNNLNSAYNLASYLSEQKIKPAVTYPWPFPVENSRAALEQLGTLLSRMPDEDLPPYFTALEEANIEKNRFAFYTLRSMLSARSAEPASDPLNNGFFILGGGEEQTDLFTGEFVSVDVLDDAWYNTQLLAVQVAGGRKIKAKQLPRKYGKTMLSNSIIDSGTNSLYLSSDVFSAIMSSLKALNSGFVQQIEGAASDGVPSGQLKLEEWPDITFTLKGEDGTPVSLTCAPSTYWQVDAPTAGRASFAIFNSGGPQSILGLPLMNNYYTVFDRTVDAYGAIRFAPIVPPPSH